MKIKNKYASITSCLLVVVSVLFCSCDESTGMLGVYPEVDDISNSTGTFYVTTKSCLMDKVVANSTTCYLGNIIDPETDTELSAEFATQFYCFEDYDMPARELMIGNYTITAEGDTIDVERGKVQCDSCEIRIYFDDFYGDKNNPMKIEVFAMDKENLLEEDSIYYTNTDLSQFLPADAKPLVTKVFTPEDYSLSELDRNNYTYNRNVRIKLPSEFGQKLLEKYYEDPSNFKDSYHFIRNVCPGFLFRTSQGKGTLLSAFVSTMNIYFDYGSKIKENAIYQGLVRFAATPEVLQSTHIQNGAMDQLIGDHSCTYLKTPAGISTEITFPINEIFGNEHAADSVSLATLTLTKYNKVQDNHQLGTPDEILMVRKTDAKSFFENKQVSDNRLSYTTTFDSIYNTYTFGNICRLLSYCNNEKRTQMQEMGLTEAQWEALNPDWNKVLLIPVKTSTAVKDGLTQQVSVTNDMNLNSIRLVGGDTPIQMQVIYSKFNQ